MGKVPPTSLKFKENGREGGFKSYTCLNLKNHCIIFNCCPFRGGNLDTFLIKENGGWREGGQLYKRAFFCLPTFKLNKALSSDPDLVKIGPTLPANKDQQIWR